MHYVYLGIAIVAEVIATSSLKAAEEFTRPIPSIVVVIGYAIAFYCLSLSLRVIPVGIAYAIWSALGVVLVCIAGSMFYGQMLDTPALVGIGLIVAGVVVINLMSSSVTH
jgi:small multidrug resistance pump